MYDFDCNNAYALCRTAPSLPFRRVSTYDVRAHYTQSGDVYYWFAHDTSLEQLPGLANSSEAVWLAVVKLSLLILAVDQGRGMLSRVLSASMLSLFRVKLVRAPLSSARTKPKTPIEHEGADFAVLGVVPAVLLDHD